MNRSNERCQAGDADLPDEESELAIFRLCRPPLGSRSVYRLQSFSLLSLEGRSLTAPSNVQRSHTMGWKSDLSRRSRRWADRFAIGLIWMGLVITLIGVLYEMVQMTMSKS